MDEELLNTILEKINAVSDDIKEVKEKIYAIDLTLVKQEANIQEHMKRSDYLEKLYFEIEEELKPIQEHVSQVHGVAKFLGVLGASITFILGVLKLIGKL